MNLSEPISREMDITLLDITLFALNRLKSNSKTPGKFSLCWGHLCAPGLPKAPGFTQTAANQ